MRGGEIEFFQAKMIFNKTSNECRRYNHRNIGGWKFEKVIWKNQKFPLVFGNQHSCFYCCNIFDVKGCEPFLVVFGHSPLFTIVTLNLLGFLDEAFVTISIYGLGVHNLSIVLIEVSFYETKISVTW